MTFYPKRGKYSREEFLSTEGAEFTSPTSQVITGGFVTLKSLVTGTSSFITSWYNPIDWTIEDSLNNEASVASTFYIASGQGIPVNTVTGFQGIQPSSNSWYISTSYPQQVNGYYSGVGDYGIALSEDSPNKSIFDSYEAGSNAITFEFDVACLSTHQGYSGIAGFSVTGNNLTGLSPVTGVLNHGLLFCNSNVWDFIEVTPDGVRSMNHPELAIPINLYSPKKIRVGFRGSDIVIATEDGRSVIGYNKFDTPANLAPISAFAFFGAPSPDAYYGVYITGIDASVATSLWDNIKVLTGDLQVFQNTGIEQLYTRTYATMYTDVFNPDIYINKYLYANIGYIPLNGGDTVVSAQYSGAGGWTTYSSISLTTERNATLDLTSFPVRSYPTQNGSTNYLSNPIRFKIDQRSTLGNGLPPVVDYIEVFADKSTLNIDLLPDWKSSNQTVDVKFYVQTGSFITSDPVPELWTSLLFNAPTITGSYSQFIDEAHQIPITVVGSGEVNLTGPYRSSYKNIVDVAKKAVSGSAAYQYFGSSYIYNFFPNPLFSEGFREVNTGEAYFVSGKVGGYLAKDLGILPTYTGLNNIIYEQIEIYRPESQATVERINSYLGRTSSPGEEYLQGVYIPDIGQAHDGTAGIRATIPSGLPSGNLKVSLDLQIEAGTGIAINIVGNTTSSYTLPGDLFRDYKSISLPYTHTNNNTLYVDFVVPSGYSADDYRFNIDNLTVSPFESSYLTASNITGALHTGGFTSGSPISPGIVSTVFNTDIYLYSYPESSGIIAKFTGSSGRGLTLSLDNSGYVHVNADCISHAWGISGTSNLLQKSEPSISMTSNHRLPLGTWVTVGYLHDVHIYSGFYNTIYSGLSEQYGFTATNRHDLSIDGWVTESYDGMTGWGSQLVEGNIYPYATNVDLTGQFSMVAASGIRCQLDGLYIKTPPVADAESELALKGARSHTPYFVPDQLYAGGNVDYNKILHYLPNSVPNRDLYIGSCYNFSGPGYINWDRGHLNNHLVVIGSYSIESNNPYNNSNLNSTWLHTGTSAIARYSSAYDRLQNNVSTLGDGNSWLTDDLTLSLFGWLYPRQSGVFFTVHNSKTNPNRRLELAVDTNSSLLLSVYNAGGSLVYTNTGSELTLSGWNFIDTYYASQEAANGNSFFKDANGIVVSNTTFSGVGVGMVYSNESESQMVFGGEANANFFNWVLEIPSPYLTGDTLSWLGSESKSGRYQALLKDGVLQTGAFYNSFYQGNITMYPSSSGEDRYYSLAMHNSYNLLPGLNGIQAHDNKPFKVIPAYTIQYNTESITRAFGSTNSPFKIGNQVPSSAVNIAKFSSPTHTVASSVATIDLSDTNISNLVTYRNGEYEIGNSDFIEFSTITGYNGINTSLYSGRYDITFSGKVLSSDVEISTIGITNQETNTYDKAYYYYLVGRGSKVVKCPGTYPHYTGQLTSTSTGAVVDNYTANLQRIKNSIKLKTRNGDIIDPQLFPYDIAISPYTPSTLYEAVINGEDISLDNIGIQDTDLMLDDNLFSVILLTTKNKLDSKSVFIHYDAVDIVSNDEIIGHKEVVNPQPIFRQAHDMEPPQVGQFKLSLNSNNYYDLKFYGLATGFSGEL